MSLRDFVSKRGRPLEAAHLAYLIGESSVEPVLQELSQFQNPDGGFGQGLEPDFWLPDSSPMATSMAFRLLASLPVDQNLPLIQRGIDYYEATFQPASQQWQPTGPEVNQYPHAPWWHQDDDSSTEAAAAEPVAPSAPEPWDGNPSAEIVGHLLRFRRTASSLPLDALVETALSHLQRQQRYETHEIQCYIKLYGQLSPSRQAEFLPVLRRAVTQLVESDPNRWGDYVPKPLDFVGSPRSPFYSDLQDPVQTQLDYLVDEMEQNGCCTPTWDWGYDPENWQQARQMWTGILTCNGLAVLRGFGRLEGIR